MSCRLLYLVGQLRDGGSERQLYYLLRSLSRKQHRPQVVVWNFRDDEKYVPAIQDLGVSLHPFDAASSGSTKIKKLRELIGTIAPDVVHSYSFYLNFAAHWAAWGTKRVAVGSVRGELHGHKKDTGPWLGTLSGRWPRHQICNSTAAADGIRRSGGPFVPRQISVVRNGVDLESFRMVPLPTAGRVCIVGVGSLISVKRWDRLIAAALQLKRKGFEFLVRIVGDGPMRESLEQQVQRLGVADYVEFFGQSDDVPALLAGATLLAHTSDSEGCPNVVMEAMACGRPVVATDAGDVPYLVSEGETGFVVHRGEDTVFVERLARLMVDRDLCHSMGKAGRAKAEREFGLDRLVSDTLTAYQTAGWKTA